MAATEVGQSVIMPLFCNYKLISTYLTPGIKAIRKVPRGNVIMEDLKKIGHVKLFPQKNPKECKANIIYSKLGKFHRDDQYRKLDLLWCTTLYHLKPQPMWSGRMQMIHSHMTHAGKSSEMFLPIVNLTPSDTTCVRSTLEYICDHAKQHGVTPVITFDQQLWWIAFMIN